MRNYNAAGEIDGRTCPDRCQMPRKKIRNSRLPCLGARRPETFPGTRLDRFLTPRVDVLGAMRRIFTCLVTPLSLGLFATSPVLSAAAQEPFDRSAFHEQVSRPTQLAIVGMTHLGETPGDWDPSALAPILDKLEAFQPDAILIEALPAESIDTLWRFRADYPEVATYYGAALLTLAARAGVALEMDLPQAQAAARQALRDMPDTPDHAWRRHMAALFLAAGDPFSAWVQWLRLPAEERRASDEMTAELVTSLEKVGNWRDEGIDIGAALAARLGLERVYLIDDHASDDLEHVHDAEFEQWFSSDEVQSILNDPRFAGTRGNSGKIGSPGEALATFRRINAGGGAEDAALVEAYLRYALSRNDDVAQAARVHLASLEARNMRQAANIREVSGDYPGGKLLVIIGSSHLPWIISMLQETPDVEVVTGEQLLH